MAERRIYTKKTTEMPDERIDTYLRARFGYARHFFQHLIERGEVRVNDAVIKKSYRLQDGDAVEVGELQRFGESVILAEAPQIDIAVLHETTDYIVIHKPAGVLAHPNSIWDVGEPSVAGWLYHRYADLPSTQSFVRAGLVHRLDKATHGLMICVLSERGLAYFRWLFDAKSQAETVDDKDTVPLHKSYTAMVNPTPAWRAWLCRVADDLPYLIDADVCPRTPTPIPPKRWLTIVQEIAGDIETPNTLMTLQLQILTGRTHQIRYHLSHYGCPIVGDYLYGGGETHAMRLCASRLAFVDPDSVEQTFVAVPDWVDE